MRSQVLVLSSGFLIKPEIYGKFGFIFIWYFNRFKSWINLHLTLISKTLFPLFQNTQSMASQSPNKLSPPNGQSRRKSINGRFVLGIDVGTTSVKVCLVNVDTGEVSHKFVKDTLATAAKDLPNADLQVQSKFSFNWFILKVTKSQKQISLFPILKKEHENILP